MFKHLFPDQTLKCLKIALLYLGNDHVTYDFLNNFLSVCYEFDVLMKPTSGAGLLVKLELVYRKTLLTTLGSFSQNFFFFSPPTTKIQIHGE